MFQEVEFVRDGSRNARRIADTTQVPKRRFTATRGPEVGATESGGNREKKVAWIKDLFQGIKDNPQIIGFSWFDQSIEGNDWRIESSAAATEEFATGVADPSFGSGVWYPR